MITVETPIIQGKNSDTNTSPFTVIFILAVITFTAVIALKKSNPETNNV